MAKEQTRTVGGLAFLFSLLFLALIGPLNLKALPGLLDRAAVINWTWFAAGALCGFALAKFFIRAHLSVFVHELKHSILSNLAGNRARGMRIRRRSGHFEYSYTADTAAYNAFISLAPYIFPLMTIPALGAALLFFSASHHWMVLMTGLGVGMDISLNSRDVGPHQTDINQVIGGYYVGLAYILLMNLALCSLLAFWISAGLSGLEHLAQYWWNIGSAIVMKR